MHFTRVHSSHSDPMLKPRRPQLRKPVLAPRHGCILRSEPARLLLPRSQGLLPQPAAAGSCTCPIGCCWLLVQMLRRCFGTAAPSTAHPESVVRGPRQLPPIRGAGEQRTSLCLVEQEQCGCGGRTGSTQANPANPLQPASGVSSKHTHAQPCANLVFVCDVDPLEGDMAGAADLQDARPVHQVNHWHRVYIGCIARRPCDCDVPAHTPHTTAQHSICTRNEFGCCVGAHLMCCMCPWYTPHHLKKLRWVCVCGGGVMGVATGYVGGGGMWGEDVHALEQQAHSAGWVRSTQRLGCCASATRSHCESCLRGSRPSPYSLSALAVQPVISSCCYCCCC